VFIIEQAWQQFPTGHFVKHLKKLRIQGHGKMLQACNSSPLFKLGQTRRTDLEKQEN